MKIAVKNPKEAEKLKGHEIIYAFKDEPLQELLDTGLHCVRVQDIGKVDINLTDYDIRARKKAKIDDKDLFVFPKIKQNKYAIIVPNYNNNHGDYKGKTFLRNCIESITNQTYKNYELIIVDDMSTDDSVDTIKEYMLKPENVGKITLIENKRKRYNGGSRNVGIEYALKDTKPDYICFLDSDDWWKHEKVLETINEEIGDSEMALLGMELVDQNGVFMTKFHEYKNYEDFFLSDNKVWCTAWSRVIRADKIVYFPESTLMEDRTWSYEQADQIDDLTEVKNIKEVCYVWNRANVSNSVSIVRNGVWDASAWKHIGEQLMLIERLKHKEMIPILQSRIQACKGKINRGIYQQY